MKLFCPSCGASLEFRYDDSFVRVCPSCHSAIARTDRGIDTLGQFADLAPSGSGLALGASGRYQGRPFVLAGRAEYAHPGGGSWEEWFIKLGDGRWGWLSHAEGRWAILFRTAAVRELPAFEALAPGEGLNLGYAAEFAIGEHAVASARGAEGELPFLFRPGALVRFVDASDDQGRVATVDYGEPGASEGPELYLGRWVRPAELGLDVAEAAARRSAEPSRAPAGTGERLACPNCNGSIELRVPGRSLSVACPYCGSLLDCEGPLSILARLAEVDAEHPAAIALGAVGRFEGVEYTVTGRLRRQAKYPGGVFDWEEYLLFAPDAGYRWLVNARGHYSFVTPLPPGAAIADGASARYRGTSFKLFDRGRAEVTHVWGEFYWKVALGEAVDTLDFIAPPAMLSCERSASELHWSLGVYLAREQVKSAFALPKALEASDEVGANQPFRHVRWTGVAVLLAALLVACVAVRLVSADARQAYVGRFPLEGGVSDPSGTMTAGSTYVFFSPPFELSGGRNVGVRLELPLSNNWAYASVDLIHEGTGALRTYGTELSYYFGVDGGERWSEGSTSDEHLFSAGAAGSHVLRLEVQTPAPPGEVLTVTVAENVFAGGQLGWLLVLLGVPTALLALAHGAFERWRWSNSDFAPAYLGLSSDE